MFPGSGEGSSAFSVWTEEMWARKKEAYPWIDCKDGKLGCEVCANIIDFSVFNDLERKTLSEHDWRFYNIIAKGNDKRSMLTYLRSKIMKHKRSEGHVTAQQIQDDPHNYPKDDLLQKATCNAYQYGLVSYSQHADKCKICQHIDESIKAFVQSRPSLIGRAVSLPVEYLLADVDDKPQPQEDRHEYGNATRKRKITSVLHLYEETVSSSTEPRDGSHTPDMSMHSVDSPSTPAPGSSEEQGSSPFSVWTEKMWASKKETNPWIDCRDGKLGCRVCSSVMDFSAFNQVERKTLSEHDWRFYSVTDKGKDKKAVLANLRSKILKHKRSEGHIAAQQVQDDPSNYPKDNQLQKAMCNAYYAVCGLISYSQHAAKCKICQYIESFKESL